MKFEIRSMDRPRRVAKSLAKALSASGHAMSLSACQKAVARMYGHADWHALARSPKTGASLADADAGPAVAAARRELQLAVLTAMGIPAAAAAAALDHAAPTGRGAAGPRAVPVPRLLIHARFTDAEGNVTDLGPQDLTQPMVEDLVRWGLATFEEHLANGHRSYRLVGHLTEKARHLSGRRGFEFVDPVGAWARFKSEVGDLSDPRVARRFEDHLLFTRSARGRVGDSERMLRNAEMARFSDGSGIVLFVPAAAYSDRFYSTPGEAYEGDLYDAYLAEVEKRCDADYGTPEWNAWQERYSAWERQRTPPFVWGTVPKRWDGIDAASIREAVVPAGVDEETGVEEPPMLESDIGDMIESDLTDNHHEDALDQVEDWEGLAFIDEWVPHAGNGDAVDLALEAKIAEWNARQTIVSYWEDTSTIVPVREGITRDEIVGWCRQRLADSVAALEACGVWTEPRFPPADAHGGHDARSSAFVHHPRWRAGGQ